MSTLDDWLEARGACSEARLWAATQPDHSPAALVAACPRGEWLLWLAQRLGYDAATLASAVRPAWLRAVREYTPAALDDAGMPALAATFRALPSEAEPSTVSEMAHAAVREMSAPSWPVAWAAAMAARAAQSGQVSTAAREAAYAADMDGAWEHARCADDVRRALPDLAQRWAKVLA